MISGQYYFIILLLYFYQELNVKTLIKAIKELYSRKYDVKEFDIIYTSAIKRLFKEGIIKKDEDVEKKISYRLTDKGYDSAIHLLSSVSVSNREKVIDGIRLKIMYSQYY